MKRTRAKDLAKDEKQVMQIKKKGPRSRTTSGAQRPPVTTTTCHRQRGILRQRAQLEIDGRTIQAETKAAVLQLHGAVAVLVVSVVCGSGAPTTTTTIAKFSSGVRERSLSRRKPRNFTGAWRLTATCACGRDWGYLNIDKSAKWQRTRQLMIVPSLSW